MGVSSSYTTKYSTIHVICVPFVLELTKFVPLSLNTSYVNYLRSDCIFSFYIHALRHFFTHWFILKSSTFDEYVLISHLRTSKIHQPYFNLLGVQVRLLPFIFPFKNVVAEQSPIQHRLTFFVHPIVSQDRPCFVILHLNNHLLMFVTSVSNFHARCPLMHKKIIHFSVFDVRYLIIRFMYD